MLFIPTSYYLSGPITLFILKLVNVYFEEGGKRKGTGLKKMDFKFFFKLVMDNFYISDLHFDCANLWIHFILELWLIHHIKILFVVCI